MHTQVGAVKQIVGLCQPPDPMFSEAKDGVPAQAAAVTDLWSTGNHTGKPITPQPVVLTALIVLTAFPILS